MASHDLIPVSQWNEYSSLTTRFGGDTRDNDRDVVFTRSLRNGIPINYHYHTPREWRLSGTFNF